MNSTPLDIASKKLTEAISNDIGDGIRETVKPELLGILALDSSICSEFIWEGRWFLSDAYDEMERQIESGVPVSNQAGVDELRGQWVVHLEEMKKIKAPEKEMYG